MTPQVPGGNGYSECRFNQQHGYLLLLVAGCDKADRAATFPIMPQVGHENKENFAAQNFKNFPAAEISENFL
jgi:hypothetical protein